MNDVIAEIRKDYIYGLAKRQERADGRALDEYRAIQVKTGLIEKAEGSARVKIGNTQVLVGIKLQPGEPFLDSPDTGVIITNVELVPLASPSFEPGPPDENAIELARVVDRGVRESGALDLSELTLPDGKVWLVFIDVHVLDHDGNLMDASALGALAALLNAKTPAERYGYGPDAPLPIKEYPLAVTAVDLDGEIMLDPSLDEQTIASSRLTVISGAQGALAGMQKAGTGTLSSEEISRIVKLATSKAMQIRDDVFGELGNG
ncbi:MAG: exosome complex protein Rrp42 [Halobacteriota archaeon]